MSCCKNPFLWNYWTAAIRPWSSCRSYCNLPGPGSSNSFITSHDSVILQSYKLIISASNLTLTFSANSKQEHHLTYFCNDEHKCNNCYNSNADTSSVIPIWNKGKFQVKDLHAKKTLHPKYCVVRSNNAFQA